MKIPGLGKIASFALNKIVIPAIGRAIADRGNPLDANLAQAILVKEIEKAALRKTGKLAD